ncbi:MULTISPECIES: 2-phospho-L-lactate transferase [Methanobacterium]|jgi:LPPG:FO 2-phospho-L-lactate transferase|uniref:2-phospho-L-lactate transferase n=1 Tax=Methanobacterium veterum TaxID=408577 RepID=A0A9E5A1E0_9EURY|nr:MULTISPECIES: 2-phospho-L-lactate transferase [Methanobacterium]MCZ3365125.1 2-phospho-L-lactate transferase [Methanobacterium veterum]MCZ3372880.1 2-phospho-L-lactate transferase [Methanobacterium veterum]
MITILSGGTGTPKLIQGIARTADPDDINIIVNTVENTYISGNYIAPDIDTVMYTLAGIINENTWYGINKDTFITHETLKEMGYNEILRIGDKDRAIKIQKTMLMEKYPLSKVVDIQRKKLDIKSKIIPMSDEQSNIKIITDEGEMSFHQFLVEKKAQPEVEDIIYADVKPSDDVITTIEDSDMVIIGPSNPITSIGPIISMKGVKEALKNSYVVAVSPIIGGNPVSGPAAKFMNAMGYEVSCEGVATIYKEFMDKFIIDVEDTESEKKIEKLISKVVITNTNMKTINDKVRLARIILGEIL